MQPQHQSFAPQSPVLHYGSDSDDGSGQLPASHQRAVVEPYEVASPGTEMHNDLDFEPQQTDYEQQSQPSSVPQQQPQSASAQQQQQTQQQFFAVPLPAEHHETLMEDAEASPEAPEEGEQYGSNGEVVREHFLDNLMKTLRISPLPNEVPNGIGPVDAEEMGRIVAIRQATEDVLLATVPPPANAAEVEAAVSQLEPSVKDYSLGRRQDVGPHQPAEPQYLTGPPRVGVFTRYSSPRANQAITSFRQAYLAAWAVSEAMGGIRFGHCSHHHG